LNILFKNISVYICLSLASAAQAQPWLSELHSDHPLTGKIWSGTEQDFLSREELINRLADAELVLLGEKHDNPDHHNLRLAILRSLLSTDPSALIVMEMMTQAQQPAIDSLSSGNPLPAADTWQQLLEWDDAWQWQFYQPTLELALQNRVRLVAGNISAETMMAIYRSETAPDQPLNQAQLAKLSEEIDISHCGMLPSSQIPAMVRVQQARDQQMADSLMETGEFNKRILLAGNYHVRHDLSVPNYLNLSDTAAGSTEVLNLAFLEVIPALTQPDQYLPDADVSAANNRHAYDLIWFTPAVRADDYCADLAR
jgi:uncharacterized iron-regulated protein